MKKQNEKIIKKIFEDIIKVIGEEEFIHLLNQHGYKLIDKEKYYGRNKNINTKS